MSEKELAIRERAHMLAPEQSMLVALRREIQDSLAKSPELPKASLETRVARFTANPGMDYARHAVAYLWKQKGQFPGHYLPTRDLPDAVFSSCKHSFRIAPTDASADVVEAMLKDAISMALADTLVVKPIFTAGGEGDIIEKRPYIFHRYKKEYQRLPAHAVVSYRRFYDEKKHVTCNEPESVSGLTLADFELRAIELCGGIKRDETISLGDFCDRIRQLVQERRYVNQNCSCECFQKKPQSPFEKDMGKFFFKKLTGEDFANPFRKAKPGDGADEEYQVNDETIDAIVERILERHGPDENTTEILWQELPELSSLPRTQKQLNNYVLHRSMALVDEYGERFFEKPSPTVEVDFLAVFMTKLGMDRESYNQQLHSYLKLPESSFLSLRNSREKSRKKLLAIHDDVGDLYKQTLTIYQMLTTSNIVATASKDSEHHTSANFLQRAAWLLAKKLNASYIAFESAFYTPAGEHLYALAKLLVQDTRGQMAQVLDRADDLAAAVDEVNKIAPPSDT